MYGETKTELIDSLIGMLISFCFMLGSVCFAEAFKSGQGGPI